VAKEGGVCFASNHCVRVDSRYYAGVGVAVNFERVTFLITLSLLVVMLVGSNYQLAEQRKHTEQVLSMMKVLKDRQDELKWSLAASEKQRLELLGLWERVNPKYFEGPEDLVVMDE
jgi:hypothetical protein